MFEKRPFIDMMNRSVDITFPPQRIISVVPSQTELLFDLGLDKEVIGITKFCVHPSLWFQTKQRIGGTKKLHIDEIIALRPDLIIANKEENTQAEIELLAQNFPVWLSDIKTIDGALDMITLIGALVNRSKQAEQLIQDINLGFETIEKPAKPLSVAYFIWRNPWMTIGHDTFIHDVICRMGLQNVYSNQARYPKTSLEEIKKLNPEFILLSSEPYPFAQQHIAELKALLPGSKIILVEGEMFSWYGSRMRLAAPYLGQLLNDFC